MTPHFNSNKKNGSFFFVIGAIAVFFCFLIRASELSKSGFAGLIEIFFILFIGVVIIIYQFIIILIARNYKESIFHFIVLFVLLSSVLIYLHIMYKPVSDQKKEDIERIEYYKKINDSSLVADSKQLIDSAEINLYDTVCHSLIKERLQLSFQNYFSTVSIKPRNTNDTPYSNYIENEFVRSRDLVECLKKSSKSITCNRFYFSPDSDKALALFTYRKNYSNTDKPDYSNSYNSFVTICQWHDDTLFCYWRESTPVSGETVNLTIDGTITNSLFDVWGLSKSRVHVFDKEFWLSKEYFDTVIVDIDRSIYRCMTNLDKDFPEELVSLKTPLLRSEIDCN